MPRAIHRMTKTPTWNSWRAMMKRCYQVSHKHYKHYGGGGIVVCARWHKFTNFYEDMGERPVDMTIDRVDPSQGYSAENCRWATNIEQTANRRDAQIIEIEGIKKTACQWSRVSGTPTPTIDWRYRKGWSAKDAVFGRAA